MRDREWRKGMERSSSRLGDMSIIGTWARYKWRGEVLHLMAMRGCQGCGWELGLETVRSTYYVYPSIHPSSYYTPIRAMLSIYPARHQSLFSFKLKLECKLKLKHKLESTILYI